MEDGEIPQPPDYHPSLEFIGDEEDTWKDEAPSHPPPSAPSKQPLLRLVVNSSTCLRSTQRLAILDYETQVHIGRDAASEGHKHIPRLRLKELAVSKLHACIYWDSWSKAFSMVDMGSKHGTFVNGKRLSPERSSSIPFPLTHLAQVSVGNTVFSVHIHPDMLPCEECSVLADDSNTITLRPMSSHPSTAPSKPEKSLKRKAADLDGISGDVLSQPRVDSKRALNDLKRNLLSRHSYPRNLELGGVKPESYIDRSAKRRALHAATPSDAPGSSAGRLIDTAMLPYSPAMLEKPPLSAPFPEPVSDPPKPLVPTNTGYQLLIKQGWVPGSGFSATDGEGRREPLQLFATHGRQGLGMGQDDERPRGLRH